MHYTLDHFAQEIHAALVATARVPDALIELQPPKASIPADLALPAFRAARALGMAPPALATELAAQLRFPETSLVGSVSASGPFVNFTLAPAALARRVIAEVISRGAAYGHDDAGAGQTTVIDYSSPNVAKRMHIGHIRSTIIGQSLVHIFQALGYQVVADNHLGDIGTGMGRLLYAIERWGWPGGALAGEAILAELERLYQQANQLEEAEEQRRASGQPIAGPSVADAARAWSLRLETGDPQAQQLWERIVALTLQANQRNYDRLGVRFDHSYGESFYTDMMPPVLEHALEHGVAVRDADNSVVVHDLAQLPSFVLQRSDGGSLYHTRDVATIIFRERQFRPRQIIYVVEQRQELHFRQLFALVRTLGYARDITLVHVMFGTIFDAHGQPFSTRKGNMLYLESLLDEAEARARAIIDQKNPELPEPEKQRIAAQVGIGAVIYNDLYQDPRRNITLDWDRMLAFEGNSAPYLQYTGVRCRSILREAGLAVAAPEQEALAGPALRDAPVERLVHPSETALIKQVARLPQAIREAGARYAPNVIAEWCYETARACSAFYRDCPVLRAEPELRAARLVLTAATAQALGNGLALLGIQVPERM